MVIESIKDDVDILECAKCGLRSWVTKGEKAVKCEFCDHVEKIGGRYEGTKEVTK